MTLCNSRYGTLLFGPLALVFSIGVSAGPGYRDVKESKPPGGHVAPASCAELAQSPDLGLAGNPVITAVTANRVSASGSNAGYCDVQITYSARSGSQDGYDVGQAQAIKIRVGLPLNSIDGGAGGRAEGAWNGGQQNLGGAGCAGTVGQTSNHRSGKAGGFQKCEPLKAAMRGR